MTMSNPNASFQNHNRLFIVSLVVIIVVISFFEAMIMFMFEVLHDSGVLLEPLQEGVLDAALLSLLSAPCLWFFSLRPLALSIERKNSKLKEQTRLNTELRTALDTHALVSISDSRGLLIFANDKFCTISGYSREELIGQDHRIVNSGYHDKTFIRNLWETISAGQVWQGEICNRAKNGLTYWVDSTIVPLLDNTGKPRQYISIRRDVTIQKNSELKLIALRRALDASSEMIIITDPQGYIQYVNAALCRFTRWNDDELIGQKAHFLDDGTIGNRTDMESALQRGDSWFGRIKCRRRVQIPGDNRGQIGSELQNYWAELSVTPILNKDGTIFGYVQIQRDVTAQISKEEELLSEKQDAAARLFIAEILQQIQPLETRYSQVLDILLALKGFDTHQKGGVLLKFAAEDHLENFVLKGEFNQGFTEKVQDLLSNDSFGGHTRDWNEPIVCGSFLLNSNSEASLQGIEPHGHYLVPIMSGHQIQGVLFLYTDPDLVESESRIRMLGQVAEMMALALLQEQAKTNLRTSRDAAIQAAAMKTEFLANMSHEIRTPMNGVLGMLDLLKDTELTHEQWNYLDTAANSAEALLDIINDILDFSKMEAGKFVIDNCEFDLALLVEEVCSLMSTRAHDKGLELNCYVPTNLPHRWQGDSLRIRQVLTNLIGNAIKFTEKGEVSIFFVENETDTGIKGLRFEVLDTGIGIAEEMQSLLFQPFTQADSSTSRHFGGTGLGLSISHGLIKLMEGEIGFESVFGQGSRFWFTLPILPITNESQNYSVDFSSHRALIVDDNATNRIILEHYLIDWGFTVVHVDNASSAFHELNTAVSRGTPFTLLLSDLHMPEMDGLALIEEIKKSPAIAAIPKILLTSGGKRMTEDERVELSIAHCLIKPVRQLQLFDAVVDALQVAGLPEKPINQLVSTLPDYSDKKILVAEDNKVNQKVILALLARFQIKPDVVENGKEVLDQLARQHYDLILMDCQMPIMDGYEATRHIRALEITHHDNSHLPIVALTAHAAPGERDKCLSAGMDNHLGKPVSKEKLAAVLKYWFKESADSWAIEQQNRLNESSALAEWDEALALQALDGDEDLLNDIVVLFIDEAPGQLTALINASQKGDMPALAEITHKLKGMAGHFCATTIVEMAGKLENSARQNLVVNYQEMTEELNARTTKLVNHLQNRKGKIYE